MDINTEKELSNNELNIVADTSNILAGMKILVVEDNELNLEIVTEV